MRKPNGLSGVFRGRANPHSTRPNPRTWFLKWLQCDPGQVKHLDDEIGDRIVMGNLRKVSGLNIRNMRTGTLRHEELRIGGDDLIQGADKKEGGDGSPK